MKHLANQKSVGAPPIKGSVVVAKTKILWVVVYIPPTERCHCRKG